MLLSLCVKEGNDKLKGVIQGNVKIPSNTCLLVWRTAQQRYRLFAQEGAINSIYYKVVRILENYIRGKIYGYCYYNLRPSIALGLNFISALLGRSSQKLQSVFLWEWESLFNEHLISPRGMIMRLLVYEKKSVCVGEKNTLGQNVFQILPLSVQWI